MLRISSTWFPLNSMIYFKVNSIVGIIGAIGLVKGIPWGGSRLVLSGFEILIGIFVFIEFALVSPTFALTTVIVNLVVIFYLTRPEVLEYFNTQ